MLAVTTTTWLALGALATAVFSAVAAGAAWAAVWQARRLADEAREPLLHLSTVGQELDGRMYATVRNGGGGVARAAWMFLAFSGHGDVLLSPLPPDSMMAPGSGIRLALPWPLAAVRGVEAMGLAVCEDRHGNLYAWTGGGAEKRWDHRRLKRRPRSKLEIIRAFFPDFPDPQTLRPVDWQTWEDL